MGTARESELVAVLRAMIASAQAGELKGMVAITLTDDAYDVMLTGSAESHITYALGALSVAQVELAQRLKLRAEHAAKAAPGVRLSVVRSPGG
jgi:hypothetical protein